MPDFERELLSQLSELISTEVGESIQLSISNKFFLPDSIVWEMRTDIEASEDVFYCQIFGTEEDKEIRFWLWPDDPSLPQLKVLAVRESAEIAFKKLVPDFDIIETQAVSYRPTKRAIFRFESPTSTLWAKVVPEVNVEKICENYERLASANLPVPRLVNWSRAGILVFESTVGTSASELQSQYTIKRTCDQLLEFLSDLQNIPPISKAKRFPSERLDAYEPLVGQLAPNLGEVFLEHRMKIESTLSAHSAYRHETHVHGDLHLGQIFYDEVNSQISIIDFDNSGRGDLHAEIGNLYSALWFSELINPCSILTIWKQELQSIVEHFKLHEALLKSEILANFLARLSTLPVGQTIETEKVAEILAQIKISPTG